MYICYRHIDSYLSIITYSNQPWMVVSDINMVRRVSLTINRYNWSSLAMLFTTLTLITLLIDLAYSSVSCGFGTKSLGGKKLQSS